MGEGGIQMLSQKRKIRSDDDKEEEERKVNKTYETIKVYSRRKLTKEENKSTEKTSSFLEEKKISKNIQVYSRRNKITGSKSVDDVVAANEEKIVSQKGSKPVDEKSDQARVREHIRTFHKHYLHFVQQEQERVKKIKKASKGKVPAKKPSKRPDLKAMTNMIDAKAILYPDKRPGHLAGIDVGKEFFSRAEMVVVGLHSHWLKGIDYMPKYKNYTVPIAVSIVLSGQYEDDEDNFDEIIYTGQGGNDYLGNKRQKAHQVLKHGNLALKNNKEKNIPVRVIRGEKCRGSYTRKVYTYSGLYNVVDVEYLKTKGGSGYKVYQYKLKRIEGQPPLKGKQVKFTNAGRARKAVDDGVVCKDISRGNENVPIRAINLVDHPQRRAAPTGLEYITTSQCSASVEMPRDMPTGCKCKGDCTDPRKCACARLNGSDFPYVRYKNGGRLTEARDVVYECGPNCGCGAECVNRTTQGGLKYRLEVFLTAKKGWGVRSRDFIPIGSFVCEYVGVIKRTDEVKDPNNFYYFDIDLLQTMKGLDKREKRLGKAAINPSAFLEKQDNEVDFCIDSETTGNITRYINHSCAPNLYVQCVLSDHHDARLARIVLFAADNIPPYQELSYDYGYGENSVKDKDGKFVHMPCHCGAADCKGIMF